MIVADRERMIREQLVARGIDDSALLAAMRTVPRHLFVEGDLASDAYADRPLPIGFGQTISQPYIVALMTQLSEVRPGDRVLEIGTGSGYQAAVLAEMGIEVFSVEHLEPLAALAREKLASLGYGHVHVRVADGNEGWPDAAPFDAVLVTAAVREVPRQPARQLQVRGRMVLPIGTEQEQEMVRIWRMENTFQEEYFGGCRFVRLIGRHGWDR